MADPSETPIGNRMFFVLGSHRSGTSALARTLNLLGLRLPADLVGPNPTNPEGHWEPRKLVQLNDRLLADHERHWADPKPMPSRWRDDPRYGSQVAEAAALMRDDFPDMDRLIVKDPRLSRLLPIWRDALSGFAVEPVCLIAWRNPLEVAMSLHRRDRMEIAHALQLWRTYQLEAEFHSRELPRAVIRYDELVADWETSLGAAFAELGLPMVKSDLADQASPASFLQDRHRHHRSSDDDLAGHTGVESDIRALDHLFRGDIALKNQDGFDALRAQWHTHWEQESPGEAASAYPPQVPAWHIERSIALEGENRLEDAVAGARRAVELNLENGAYRLRLADLLLRTDKQAEAADVLAGAIGTVPEDADLRHWLGRLLMQAGNVAEAEPQLRRAIELGGSAARFHAGHADALKRLGRIDEALTAARRAVGLEPDNPNPRHLLGTILLLSGDLEEAETHLRRAIECGGEEAWFHTALANALNRLGRTAEAAIEARRAVERAPDRLDPRHLLGTLLMRIGEDVDAEHHLDQAIRLGGSQARFHAAHANALARLGRLDEAIVAFRTAAERQPGNARFRYRLAQLLAEAGRPEEARIAFDESVRLGCTVFGIEPTTGRSVTAPASAGDDLTEARRRRPDAQALPLLYAQLAAQWWADNPDRWEPDLLHRSGAPGGGTDTARGCAAAIPPVRLEPGETPPALSIMLPVYNVSKPEWLETAIESVLGQGGIDDRAEIVVIDDTPGASEAEAIVGRYAPRVAYRQNPANLGLLGNHNACIAQARGELVHILHQDDSLLPGFYEALLEPMLADRTLVAGFTSNAYIDGSGETVSRHQLEQPDPGRLSNWLSRIALRQRLQFPAILVRRSAYRALGGFSAELVFAFDWDMWARLAASGPVWYDPRRLANYRIHPGSATYGLSLADRFRDEFLTISRNLALLPDGDRQAAARIALSLLFRRYRTQILDSRDADESDKTAVLNLLTRNWAGPEVLEWANSRNRT